METSPSSLRKPAGAGAGRGAAAPVPGSRAAVVAVVADDLAWATRLASIVARAGARALAVHDEAALARALEGPDAVDAVVVDCAGRSYDGLAAIARAARAGRPVLAVAEHSATALRQQARAAGAGRVEAYRRMFEAGPAVVAAWLGEPGTPSVAPHATEVEP